MTAAAEASLAAGAIDRAAAHSSAATARARTGGFHDLEGCALTVQADAARALGEDALAEQYARSALAIHRETGDLRGIQRAERAVRSPDRAT